MPTGGEGRIIRLILSLALLLAVLESCGLPSVQPNLAAPVVPAAASDPSSSLVFTFDNGAQTAPSDLYGFEIYYKFYDDTVQNASIAYNGDSTKLTAGQTGPTQLQNIGYRRLFRFPPGYVEGNQISQPSVPLIPIPDSSLKGTQFQVTIDFTNAFSPQSATSTNFYPQVDINGSPVVVQAGSLSANLTLARYLGNTNFAGGNYILQGFGNNDFAVDQGTNNGQNPPGDIPQTITTQSNATTTPQALLLGFYAIAYGLIDLTTPIYSTPTPLGYVRYSAATFKITSDPNP